MEPDFQCFIRSSLCLGSFKNLGILASFDIGKVDCRKGLC